MKHLKNKTIPVSVIIPAKNEEKNIKSCLEALQDFSQIIVVDSNSTDGTKTIVESLGAAYVNFEWNGKFPKKRNWILQNFDFKHDWVLFLDADEIITPKFQDELSRAINNSHFDGYWLKYTNHFMGKRLRFGDSMRKLALFKRQVGAYERIDEEHWSNLDMEIHEHPIIEGKVGKINSPIIHNDYRGLAHYISKHNSYSSWEARRYLQLKRDSQNSLNFRQKVKYRLLSLGLLPIVYFISSYVIKGGFLDGKEGLAFAKLKANYFYQIQLKIAEFSYNNLNIK
ncbi:Glycosyltransferase involved in cell wall bisynthesis [Robiginitalea myxolifaciens]|uniref:Glycosyltransferase involved in cell wall bisynthesis n=1 Tax=Robiginitalea myxolifaciens TaxID=400055 RepID=A0A1I6FMZ9_9FLAO|nr:glycosyltransferase family 2 protein [Robiginitalea myxolifaciens]SFR31333.1 Glycosyltransferase involved in cell wall bisynthesis [Robiginitalea myxolifaciens]